MCSRWLLSLLCCVIACSVQADDATDKARAALALAKAQRERQAAKSAQSKPMPKAVVIEDGECFTDLALARKVARVSKKPLVIWVGMTCGESPDVCKSLRDDTVGVHVPSYNDDPTPRVIVTDPSGHEYRIMKTELNETSPVGIRKRIGLPVSESRSPVYRPVYAPLYATLALMPSVGTVCTT